MTLDEWIKAQDLSNAGLSRRLQGALSRSQVSRIRRGRARPSLASARALEQATGLSAAALLIGEGA